VDQQSNLARHAQALMGNGAHNNAYVYVMQAQLHTQTITTPAAYDFEVKH
jgi:hypothetical protein